VVEFVSLPVSVFPIVSHRQQAHFVVGQKRGFVLEVSPHVCLIGAAVDGGTPSAIPPGDVSALHHESLYNTVQGTASEGKIYLGLSTTTLSYHIISYQTMSADNTINNINNATKNYHHHATSLSFNK
jgi:hypothetical protein